MGCFESDQYMNVVFDAPDALRQCIQSFDGTSEVFMKSLLPCWLNHWIPVFRSENDVSVNADVAHVFSGGWHPFRVHE